MSIKRIVNKMVIVALLAMLIAILISAFCQNNVYALSYPHVMAGEIFQEKCIGNNITIKYTILPAFKNEKIFVEIFDPNGKSVGSAEKSFYNADPGPIDYTVNWDTTGRTEGKYTVVANVYFYTMYEWHEAPNPTKSYISLSYGQYKHEPIERATTQADGIEQGTCTVCGDTYTQPITRIESVSLSKEKYTYNGECQQPTVTVRDADGGRLRWDKDDKYTSIHPCYTVTYDEGCTNVGTYTVTVDFIGNYEGTVTKNFKINPKPTAVKSITAGKNSFTVKWNMVSEQATGYQIKYSTSENFTEKTSKTVTTKSYKTTSKKIENLKINKTYYVKVRTYKTVDGVNYYSSWSKVKKVKLG